ncbi:hypothetical protein [Breznakiella homolactica]|uniref:Uncharacterized protein n=1 Tax=Breznakiella homolactica TaxID=2798577 RepID=A0A7T7XKT6_9SPIR|nr:hypothetical protein [Breznakiella homolactica]QQO08206.1 hypothetical protein JFL75_14875 [Breznakiella homolactica]
MAEKSARGLFRGFQKGLIVLCVSVIIIAGVIGAVLSRQQDIIASLEDRISRITETTIPLRFMVLSRENGAVTARFRFYNADGGELAFFEDSWEGEELAVDSLIVPVGEKYLVFPSRIFTDVIAPRDGTGLFQYYDRDGMPGIFESVGLDKTTRNALTALFGELKKEEAYFFETGDPGMGPAQEGLKNLYGNAVHDLRRIRQFEPGRVYALTIHTSGAVEIIEE